MGMLAQELGRDPRFEVHFLLDDSHPPVDKVPEGIRLHYMPRLLLKGDSLPLVSSLRNYSHIAKAIAATGCRTTILSAPGGITALCALRARLDGGRFVYRVTTDGEIVERDPMPRRRRATYLWALRSADLVLTQTDWQRDKMNEIYGIPTRILPKGLPSREHPPDPAKKEYVLWVGSGVPRTRPLLLLDVAERLPHRRFVMSIVPRGAELLAEIGARAAALPNVEVRASGVSLDGIQDVFDRATALVNTSAFEGFPNAFVQAALAGTPVIGYEVNPAGVLSGQILGLHAAGDLSKLAELLEGLLLDEPRRAELGSRAFAYARENNALQAVTARLAEMLLSLD